MTINRPAKTHNFVSTTVAKAGEVNDNFDDAFGVYGTNGYLFAGWCAPDGFSIEFHASNQIKTTANVNLTGIIQKGDRVTFENPTEKFFIVDAINYNITVPNRTTITLIGNTVTNSAINQNTVGFSRELRPKGFNIGLDLWPVGSIYTSVVNTNPSAYFGGTWVAFGAGRTLVGVDTGQTEFDTVEETGGAKTHTLSTGELPVHNHGASGLSTNTTGAHTHRTDIAFPYSTNNTTFAAGGAGAAINGTDGLQSGSAGDHSHTISGNTANAGSGQAHNNLQPYITVYFWKRTA